MMRSFLGILLLALAHPSVGLANGQTPEPAIPPGWTKVNVCQIRFFIPKSLKNQHARGIDSCVAEFRNGKMRLAIDSGPYGGPFTKAQSYLDFKEEFIELDGKRVQLITYKDAPKKAKPKFFAGIYVVLFEGKKEEGSMRQLLVMTVAAKSETDLEIARQIFHSIRFDEYRPALIEW